MPHQDHDHSLHKHSTAQHAPSLLSWSAWQRVLAVLPVVVLLWLAVWWASDGVSPW